VTLAFPTAAPDSLLPVREALLAHAGSDARRLLAEVDAEGDSIIARARAEAEAIRAEARSQGEADATAVLVAERARARRQARAVVLAAQRESYTALRARVVEEAATLRLDPAYATWRDGLGERVRAALGPDAVVTEHPEGGVLGEAPGRRVAHTLAGLATRALDALGPDVEGLWAP
jgi:vacuolar-type H+-ATPase subunit E/Vma4